jgi:hypothetical protein
MGLLKNTHSVLAENPEEIRSLGGRSRHVGEDSIKTYFNEIRRDDVYWIQLSEERIQMGSCRHGSDPSGYVKDKNFLSIRYNTDFSIEVVRLFVPRGLQIVGHLTLLWLGIL